MEKICFTYGNFRYLVFEFNHQYYLLDRRPCHLIGYLFPPINWLFFQHVYPITSDDYCKIKEKNGRATKLTVSASLGAGLSIFLYNWLRVNKIDITKYFEANLSSFTKVALFLMTFLLTYVLVELCYYSRKRRMVSVLGRELRHIQYYKITPVKIDFKQLLGFIVVFGGLAFFMALYYFYSGNLLFGLMAHAIIFLYLLASNVAFGTESHHLYKINDKILK